MASLRSTRSTSDEDSYELIGSSVTSDEIMGGNLHRKPSVESSSLRSSRHISKEESHEIIGSSVTSDEIMGGNVQRKSFVDSSSLRTSRQISKGESHNLIGASVTSDEIMSGIVHRNPFAVPSHRMDTQDLLKEMMNLNVKEKSKDVNKRNMKELAKKDEEIARLKKLLEKATRDKDMLEKQAQTEGTARKTQLEKMAEEIEALKVENGHLKDQLKYERRPLDFHNLRVVYLTRGLGDKFGFDHTGTSINRVCPGWPASANGVLQGDQIISINGINVETLAHCEISNILRRVSREAKFVLRYNPERLNDFYNFRNISKYD